MRFWIRSTLAIFISVLYLYLSRLDKCGSCCIRPMANHVCFFGSTAGPARTHFHYLTHRYTRKWPSEKQNQVIESRNTWLVAEHLEQKLRGRVPCNVTTSFGSQSPWFFWRSLSCVTVCQVMEIRPRRSRRQSKMRTRFAIGLIQQLPHLSDLLLWPSPFSWQLQLFSI